MRADNARSSPAAPGPEVRPDDATIIGRSLADPEQFAIVFRRHAPAIQRYVTRRIGPGPAEDVVAETFLGWLALLESGIVRHPGQLP